MSLQYAKQLAKAAGLPVKSGDKNALPKNELAELERWFVAHSRSILDGLFSPPEDALKASEAQMEQEYVQRRQSRYKASAAQKWEMRGFGRKTRSICGVRVPVWRFDPYEAGLFKWTFNGKLHQSWLGQRDKALLTPKQIGGYLTARYPGHDVTVQYKAHMNSSMFVDTSIMDPLVVPCYEVFITKKLPGWYLTAERLLLEGRLLDRDAAKELWEQMEAGELEQQQYADKLAVLCRQAEKFDDVPSGYVDLDDKGNFIERLPEDRPSAKTDDPFKDEENFRLLWDDEDEQLEELDDARMVAMLLGNNTREIEEVEEISSNVDEFRMNGNILRKRRWEKNKADSIPEANIEGW